MTNPFSTSNGLKSLARKHQRSHDVPYHQALNEVARAGGFSNYADASRKLTQQEIRKYPATIYQNWWGYESKTSGESQIELRLNTPLEDLVRPHHLTGYLGACRLRENSIVERTGRLRGESDTAWWIGRIARAIQFMDATGLRPSGSRRSYPGGEWDNRPPIADHDHCWYDPKAKVHILTTEPYPGRAPSNATSQVAWEREHGWRSLRSSWGSIYGAGTELHLCCPASYLPALRRTIARLEAGAAALADEQVNVKMWAPSPNRASILSG